MCLEFFPPSPFFFQNGSLSMAPVGHLLMLNTWIFHSSNVQEISDSLLGFEASFLRKKESQLWVYISHVSPASRDYVSLLDGVCNPVDHSPYSSRLSYSFHEYVLFSLAPLCIRELLIYQEEDLMATGIYPQKYAIICHSVTVGLSLGDGVDTVVSSLYHWDSWKHGTFICRGIRVVNPISFVPSFLQTGKIWP